ncbi:protein MAINTENANCE OF MERISTEMS-like [Chenopodium quinoa]|uniref:protein MAINTENANCE OF MERISTEMS-like n=1 Tax=Chenopodium quinoa TaxID=63459 RepID=UPI000B77A565|nr:protein MAINTENANCE OF MERISTEMS-like [Chenopodium quinoa]
MGDSRRIRLRFGGRSFGGAGGGGCDGGEEPEQQQYRFTSGWSRDQQSGSSRLLYSTSGAPISDEEEECSTSHAGDRDEEQDPQDFHMVYRGQSGRFVGSGSSQPTSSSAEAWLVQEPMSGGPEDGSVIPSFGGHVARYIWMEQMRSVLRCLSRTKLCSDLFTWRGRQSVEDLAAIDASWLSHLPCLMFKRLDWPLISAFVERWQPDTNTFHMPFGEITILLHNVYNILGLRVAGNMVTTTPRTDVLRDACSVTMDMTPDDLSEVCGTKTIWQGSGVLTDKIFESTLAVDWDFSEQLDAYLWLVLGGTLFVDKSGNRTHPFFLHELCHTDVPINEYAWGTAALAYLYRQLGTASRKGADSIVGCLTLLQAWIYEYFPCFRPQQGTLTRDLQMPRASAWDVGAGCPSKNLERLLAFRTRIDALTDREVNWLPYEADLALRVPPTLFIGCIQYRNIIEPYMPDRVVRQLGFVQGIPREIIRLEKAKRLTNLKMYRVDFPTEMTAVMWNRFVPGVSQSVVLGALPRLSAAAPSVAPGYMQWMYMFSHPRVSPGAEFTSNLPERTNTDYWMGRSMEIHQRALAEYPEMSSETRTMTEQLVFDWRSKMGL